MSDDPPTGAARPSYRLHSDRRQIVRPGNTSEGSVRHQQLLFHNKRIRVSDFRLQPGQQAVECRHEYPTIRWQVSYNGISEHDLIITEDDGEESKLSGRVNDRSVYFANAGCTWNITNTSSETEYRQIIFELLSDKPKYDNTEIQALFAQAKYSTEVGTKLVFENELCRCWDFYLDPSQGGGADTVHHHCLDYVFVNIAPSRLLGLDPETLSLENLLFDSVSEDNQVTWNSIPKEAATDIAFAHGGKNGYDDRPMREYLVELK